MKFFIASAIFLGYMFFFFHKKETRLWNGENPQVLEKGQLDGYTVQFGYRAATVIDSDMLYVRLRFESYFKSTVRMILSQFIKRRKRCL